MPPFEKSPPELVARFDAAAELLTLAGATPFEPMAGRPMKGYAVLPPDVVAEDATLDGWLRRSIAFGRTLPAK